MASRKKSAIESRVGHSYGDFSGYDSINYGESVELSKILNRRGIPLTSKKPKNSKSASDWDIAWDNLIENNERAQNSYAKYRKKKTVKNVKKGAK